MKASLQLTGMSSSGGPLGKQMGMSARLSERRINKLQTLVAGQDSAATLNKQRSIALQKFLVRFAGSVNDRATKTALTACVNKMVSSFFNRGSPCSAEELDSLEASIARACAAIPDEVAEYKRTFREGNNPRIRPPVPALQMEASSNARSLTLPPNITNDWDALTIAKAIDFDEEKGRDKERERKKREENKMHLDRISEGNRARERAAREEEMRERERNKAKYDEWLRQEEELKAKKAREHDELRQMYEGQIELRKVIKDKERVRQNAEAKADVARLAAQMERAAKAKEREKFEESQRYQDMILESKRSSDVKARMKQKAAEEDVRMQEEAKRILDENEAKKQKMLADKMKRYESIGKQWETAGAGKEKAIAEKKIMDIVDREAKLQAERVDARHRRDIEKIQEGKVLFHKYNSQLKNEKKEREEKEAAYEAEYARKMLADNRAAIDAEHAKVEKRKNDAVAYKAKLVEQQTTQRLAAMKLETEMAVSSTERQMNKSLFDKLRSDEELIAKINDKFVAPVRPGMNSQSERAGGSSVKDLMAHETHTGSPNKRRRNQGKAGKRATGGRR